ncbi:hypothetical protein RIF29_11112 [Crotalaria pallida]|uniref:Protein kinase domain-containing protein n=1 Tax=Crotalaria pallida TaxID=3830 RepID=A0AAN9FZI3_CROPI
MGCIFGKFESPPRKTERPKRRNVSQKGSNKYPSKHVVVKRETQKRHGVSEEKISGGGGGGVVRAEKIDSGVVVEGERERVVGREEKRDVGEKKIARYEFVGGWPKWLVDNIPRNVLDTIVPKSADSFEKLAKIGRGTYSNVYKAREKGTGKIVALKKVRFDTTDSESIKFMAREIMVLQTLDHPNVLKLEGLATSRMQYSLYLVFDYMMTDLTRIISRPGERLTEPEIKCYMQQLLSGLQHCHERGVMHRDIKASNLLIDKKGVLKIGDFGLANSLSIKPEGEPLTNRVVTLWYRAPELLLGSTDYGFGIDLWSAGCLLAEMFVGRPIMPGRTEVEQLHMIFKLCGSPPEDYYRKLKLTTSHQLPQYYKQNFEENLKNFPPSSVALLTILLDLYPARRGSAASALRSEFFKSSPLACDPSALPVIVNPKDTDERLQSKRRRRHKGFKRAKVSPSSPSSPARLQSGKNQRAEETWRDSESTKQKNIEQMKQVQETGSSGSSITSISSGSRLLTTEGSSSMNASISPVFLSSGRKSPKTEGHPNALRNIKNYSTLLQASMIDIIKPNEGSNNELGHIRRSFSMLDLRLDPEKLSNLYGLPKRN